MPRIVQRTGPVRIGLSAEWLGTQAGGMETYSRNLVEALPRVDAETRFEIHTARRGELDGLARRHANVTVRYLGVRSRWLAIPLAQPLALLRAPVDLFHATSIAPPWCPVPMVVTVHDLGFVHHPEFFPPLVRLRLSRLVRSGAMRARHVIAVSAATRLDLERTWGVSASRVSVVHEGVSPAYRPIDDPAPVAAMRRRLGLPDRYVLYVGRLHVRKNLVRLLEAFAALRKGATAGMGLVLVGRRLFANDPLLNAVHALGLDDCVTFPGHVDDADLPLVYNGAMAFVYPSLFEGFGLPPLEAMACGVPTLVADASSLPEVVGDGAIRVDPHSSEAIAIALRQLLESPSLRAAVRARGLARAAQLSWERCARETLGVYGEVLRDVAPRVLAGEGNVR